MKIPDRNDVTLEIVRGLGFDSINNLDGTSAEKVFFLGPTESTRPIGAHATEAAIKEFIAYYEHQIQCAEAYLRNGRSNTTSEWKK